MFTSEVKPNAAYATRMRQLVWPREHGAWGILLVPLVTGAWIGVARGGSSLRVSLFALAAFFLFCLRTPVESLLGTSPVRVATARERAVVLRFMFAFALFATGFGLALVFSGRSRGLLLLAALVALFLGLQFLAKRAGRRTRMLSQMFGALALTSTAPGAYYAATSQLDLCWLGLWFANWVFAGNQIHFVQLRVHASKCSTWEEKFARGRGFFIGQMLMMPALALGWAYRLVPGLVLLAFMPISIRGFVWFFSPPQPLALHRLGMAELAHAVAFGTLLILGLR